MRAVKLPRLAGLGLLTGVILSCSVAGGVSTTPPATVVPQPSVTTPVEVTTAPTAVPGTETEAPPTPIQGPAIAHLAAGQAFDVGDIRMVDASRGWAVGGVSQAEDHVLKTQDGGGTWRDVTPPEPAASAGSTPAATAYFADSSRAWVAFAPTQLGAVPPGVRVWFTGDGGASWSYGVVDTSQVSQESFVPLYLDFADGQHGWLLVALGAGMSHQYVAMFATQDGGKTWALIQDPTTPAEIQSFPKTGMRFFNAQVGWLTRDSNGVDPAPHVITTQDGGATWTRIDLPAPSGASTWFDQNSCGTYAPTATSAQSVLVLLKCLDNSTFKVEHDFLYSTTDGGSTWQSVTLPAEFTVADPPAGGLYFVSMTSGLALGRWIYRTDDGGKTWSTGKQVNWDGEFSFVDINTGWAVARNAGQVALVKTIDGGKTWQEIHPVVAP